MAQMQRSSRRTAPITRVNDRDQRAGYQIVFEQSKTNMLLAAMNRFNSERTSMPGYRDTRAFLVTNRINTTPLANKLSWTSALVCYGQLK